MLALVYEQVQIVCISKTPPSRQSQSQVTRGGPNAGKFICVAVHFAQECYANGLSVNRVNLLYRANISNAC